MRGEDYTGKKYGRLTFVRKSENTRGSRNRPLWELLCECGATHYAEPYKVINGNVRSCGCLRLFHCKGEKHGRLTYIKPTDQKDSNGSILWEVKCDCGTLCVLRPHHAMSCGCLVADHIKKVKTLGGARKFSPDISSARKRWRDTYSDADLDFDTFYTLVQLPCDYCGDMPYQVVNIANGNKDSSLYQIERGNFTYNGLDRVDSSRGHTADNVVPCCFPCNRAKGDMTREEFIRHIEKQYLHMSNRGAYPTL